MLHSPDIKLFDGTPLSVLDLAPITEGSTATESFKNSVELARTVESFGFNRYWLAEHHNMPGIASSATSVLIGHIAGSTKSIRVGAGGIMLPNHATLVIAEQFGTLESLYPDRIDLGLGRAPGSDQATAYALRRTLNRGAEEFPQQVEELEEYFHGTARVRAIPGEGLNIPIWLLGSSDFSARLAAYKGFPFSFASHFAPQYTIPAIQLYKNNFRPSKTLDRPYVMVGVNVIAADTDEKAAWLATSQQQQFLDLIRNMPSQLKPPVDNMDEIWSPLEKASVERTLDARSTIVGRPDYVREKLREFIKETEADEIIVNSQIFDPKDRVHSYEILAEMLV
ncbi:luciferase family oxidoreductase group 1 [Bacillus thermophilus]|uniref:Luciferase family oxidoreductase group 1 n=1 Tax=Siminovitchia thermophila TaxID=1245522 RepID=A0ABS2R7V4_9BACI|nr:LLM class flavin-dependent oxidoreductase [Siminovitchia thermophila]MBM7715731.1 luciferase family oxidoreductase group 1 [Siminovitchia thermophila]ONK21296.1 luciferase family oxidoreductase [Bacillus sp. VT-16-64]